MCLTHFSDVEIYGSIQGNCHFPVHFIIKAAPIRGKPSCATTWPQSFASAENADRRQIFKSRTLGGQLVFVLPVPCLTSSPQRGWRIRQITLLAWRYVSSNGGWEPRSCQWRNLEMGQRILLSIGHAALGTS